MLAAGVIDAATDEEVFRHFMDEVLVPTLRPGMVVVMDNLASHRVSGVRESLEAAGCRLVYLPPYSPDLSPIELTWSKVKQLVRTQAPRDVKTLIESIGESISQITADDCRGCFRACGHETLLLK
jgi:transposase